MTDHRPGQDGMKRTQVPEPLHDSGSPVSSGCGEPCGCRTVITLTVEGMRVETHSGVRGAQLEWEAKP